MGVSMMPTAVAAAMLAMAAFPGLAAPRLDDPLAAYRGKVRLLVVISPDGADAKLLRQRAAFTAMKDGASERDLVLIEAVGDTPQANDLRRMFALDATFHAVLVGKDGGDKLTSSEPLDAKQLFPLIDAMPMRQREMQKP